MTLKFFMKKQLLLSLLVFLFLVLGTVVVILYGKGYRFGLDNGKPDLLGTGLLVATSHPNGAEVFINGHLTTATDNTINLPGGTYDVKIFKDGYLPWEKKMVIQKEVVSKATALLLPTAPILESLTSSGVSNPTIDPSLSRIAFTVASQSAKKNGIYILDISSRPILTLQSASTQIVDDTLDSFSKATLSWSPDGKQLLASVSATPTSTTTYLLSTDGFNDSPSDVTETLSSIKTAWEKDKAEKDASRINALMSSLKQFAEEHFSIISWSPDETKILYEASSSATLPPIITPPLIGTNSTPEERTVEKGSIYVYDTKEDKNYKLLDSLPGVDLSSASNEFNNQYPLAWFADSSHLVYVHDKKIDVMEYDEGNRTTVYAGPFVDDYIFSWPSASKLVVLTDLGNPAIPPNLYSIGLE